MQTKEKVFSLDSSFSAENSTIYLQGNLLEDQHLAVNWESTLVTNWETGIKSTTGAG